MKTCDLHVHSNCSDGSYAPSELIGAAQAAGLSAVALCDHNTVAGLSRFEEAAAGTDVIAVPGVEVTAGYCGKEVHILGLFLKKEARGALTAYLETINRRKKEANRELIARLQAAGYDIDLAAVQKIAGEALPNRVHVAGALIAGGYIKTVNEGFDGILAEGAGFYESAERLDAFEVIEFLRGIAAVPVIAHPLLNLTKEELHAFLPRAKACGLVGMEVHYAAYSAAETALADALARTYGILPSGGSDFHGDNKEGQYIGKGRGDLAVPFAFYEALALWAGRHEMNLAPAPFAMIKSGKKDIELRLLDERRQCISVGDTIVFTQRETGERLHARVVALHPFADFAALYRTLPLLRCGYTEADVHTADPADMNVYYPPERQEKYGVVGIEITLVV